jgi:hypothetical protein
MSALTVIGSLKFTHVLPYISYIAQGDLSMLIRPSTACSPTAGTENRSIRIHSLSLQVGLVLEIHTLPQKADIIII